MPILYDNTQPTWRKIAAYAWKPLDSSLARTLRVFAYLGGGLLILSVVGAVLPEVAEVERQSEVQETATSAVESKPRPSLTAAELVEFDNKVVELDPDEKLVTGVTQWEDSEIVDVTVTTGFALLPQIQQGEVAIAMRDGLAKVCECRPYLKFNTEGGQRLVEIGRGQPKYKQ